MKKIISFIFLFLITNVSAQNLRNESLVNFSYIVNGRDSLGFITSGTGSIIHYIDKYYLITNYHVLTGKDYKTDKKFPALRDTNTSISIIFQPSKIGSSFVVNIYPLFDSKGKMNFETFKFKNQIIDISVMPIEIPDKVLNFAYEISDIDTSGTYEANRKLMIFGFPKGQFKNGWQPTELDAMSLTNSQRGPFIFDPYVFFDEAPIPGMSGAPVYSYSVDNQIKVLSIVSNTVDYEKANPLIKGRSILSKWGLYIIKKSYVAKMPVVRGELYKVN
jgi:hypothetical protein